MAMSRVGDVAGLNSVDDGLEMEDMNTESRVSVASLKRWAWRFLEVIEEGSEDATSADAVDACPAA